MNKYTIMPDGDRWYTVEATTTNPEIVWRSQRVFFGRSAKIAILDHQTGTTTVFKGVGA